jgi:coenzyme F420-0:L-glutamate ligase/coenzyme F420-1:gamma-L-glutamate ligase
VRGLPHLVGELDEPGAAALVRPASEDMFRLGTKEAWDEGYQAGLHARSSAE